MLTDFGAGHYFGAARLTWQSMPPGTPAYQSPELGLFQLRAVGWRDAHYAAGPADDVFALGVTAYRFVTGGYPPSPVPQRDEEGRWRMVPLYLPPPHALNPQVEPPLSTLILRMLSLAPEERGTAGELAEALDAIAVGTELEVEPPPLNVEPPQLLGPPREEVISLVSGSTPVLSPSPPVRGPDSQEVATGAEAVPPEPERSARVPVPAERARPQARRSTRRRGLALAGVGVLLVLWAVMDVHVRREGVSAREQGASEKGKPDAGPANLGDAVSAAPRASVQEPSKQEVIGQELPPKPRPGQILPDAKGRCPGRKQIPINGGCWVELSGPDAEECEQNGYVLIKERCYAPALETRRKPPPTSDQPQ
jgi:eukaryotic-like serine/threonine-protein kinase